jgi:hypothetical protein
LLAFSATCYAKWRLSDPMVVERHGSGDDAR